MRIPRKALAVGKIATGDGGKYATRGVQLRRRGDTLRAAATDGKRLMAVSWRDVTEDPLPGMEDAEKAVTDYQAVIPTTAFRRAAMSVSAKKGTKSRIVIDEPGTNGHVRIVAYDGEEETTTEIRSAVVAGEFPPVDDVIPNNKFKDGKSETAVRICVDATLFAELLLAIRDAVDMSRDSVVIEVPINPTKPVKMIRKGIDSEAVGVLMCMSMPAD